MATIYPKYVGSNGRVNLKVAAESGSIHLAQNYGSQMGFRITPFTSVSCGTDGVDGTYNVLTGIAWGAGFTGDQSKVTIESMDMDVAFISYGVNNLGGYLSYSVSFYSEFPMDGGIVTLTLDVGAIINSSGQKNQYLAMQQYNVVI
jgi:hypothetical protein